MDKIVTKAADLASEFFGIPADPTPTTSSAPPAAAADEFDVSWFNDDVFMEEHMSQAASAAEMAANAAALRAASATAAGGGHDSDMQSRDGKRQMSTSPTDLLSPADKRRGVSAVSDTVVAHMEARMAQLEEQLSGLLSTQQINDSNIAALRQHVDTQTSAATDAIMEVTEQVTILEARVHEVEESTDLIYRDLEKQKDTWNRWSEWVNMELKTSMTKALAMETELRESAVAAASSKPGSLLGSTPSELGLFLTGLDRFRAWYYENEAANVDPAQVAKDLLFECGSLYYHDRCILPRPKNKRRADVTTAIIYFRSIQHRREAIVAIKGYLARNEVRRVGVRDLFPSEAMEEVRFLHKAGFYLKEKGTVDRFRVINIADKPVLQGVKGSGPFAPIEAAAYQGMEIEQEATGGQQENAQANGPSGGNAQPVVAQPLGLKAVRPIPPGGQSGGPPRRYGLNRNNNASAPRGGATGGPRGGGAPRGGAAAATSGPRDRLRADNMDTDEVPLTYAEKAARRGK